MKQAPLAQAPLTQTYEQELNTLMQQDSGPRPPGWQLSARAVLDFICGQDKLGITRKYYGDDAIVERAIVSLMGNNGLMLVGEPGTAKSMLSELLTLAISGSSEYLIQGTAGTTEEHMKYSWNFALLLSQGPSMEALLKSPVYQAMEQGLLVRIEEITRCPQEVQDVLISILSERMLHIPELSVMVHAHPGFNVIGTANLRDKGVNDMSSALKRRFNFETVPVLNDSKLEKELILSQVQQRLSLSGNAAHIIEATLVDLLVQVFHDLRHQVGAQALEATLSTAEAVNIVHSCALHSLYWQEPMNAEHLAHHMHGVLVKDKAEDKKKLAHYLSVMDQGTSERQRFIQAGKALWNR